LGFSSKLLGSDSNRWQKKEGKKKPPLFRRLVQGFSALFAFKPLDRR